VTPFEHFKAWMGSARKQPEMAQRLWEGARPFNWDMVQSEPKYRPRLGRLARRYRNFCRRDVDAWLQSLSHHDMGLLYPQLEPWQRRRVQRWLKKKV
jgi:hypothetical protein